jgi:1-deoxy-D-xylulose-5-phosphate reductoisomerase
MNAADEACVEAFLAGRLPFDRIVPTVAAVLDEHLDGRAAETCPWVEGNATTLDDVLSTDAWARTRAGELVDAMAEVSRG